MMDAPELTPPPSYQ